MSEEPTSPSSKPADDLHGLDPGELLARGLHTVKASTGSGPWEPPTPEALARLLPQYRIESLLGRGGMGAVYKGVQPSLDRPVAIKLLPAELAGDGDFLARFQREARTLAKLQHSGIVAVHDFGQTSEGHLYFVMEYVDGTDLQQILKGPGLKPEQAFELIAQICDALHYAHRQGVIHRDIKPANILVTKDGRAKVADFGLARPLTEDSGGLTMTNMVMGTPDYMAPEQRTSATHADHRADIFALGVMLYEMLTGQRPHGAFQPPSQRVQVDVRIDEVVLKALQQEPARRYQQASEMKQDVERIRTTPPTPAKPKRSKLLVAAVALLGFIFLGLVTPFVLSKLADQRHATPQPVSPPTNPVEARLPWRTVHFAYNQAPLPIPPSTDGWTQTGKGMLHVHLAENGDQRLILGNAALRFKIRWPSEPGNKLGIFFRTTTNPAKPNGQIQFILGKDDLNFLLGVDNKEGVSIHEVKLKQPLQPGEETVFEVMAIGDTFYARIHGQVAKVTAEGVRAAGWVLIGGWQAQFKDAEYLPLDGIADPLKALGWEASARERTPPPQTTPQASSEAKKRLVEARAHLKAGDLDETRKLVDAALATAPGDLTTPAEAALIFAEAQAPERAAALAQGFVAKADAEHPQFAAITELRVKLAPTLKQYEQYLRTAAELVGKGDDAGEIRELKAALALVPDGKQAADKLAANPLHVGRALPGRRFTHGLGHTFVPVDGLPNVLFSIWETRVKDFEQFVKETGHDMSKARNSNQSLSWKKLGFEQSGDHPVVMVSRADAEAFCRWLTRKERATGRLLPGQLYRLPTDREWSAAMGVLNEPGDFPENRQFPNDVFTWEKGTQPPRNAENCFWKNDDFPNTAPVGSGLANRFGLYDIIGNVKEICADPWSFNNPQIVLRGGSFRVPETWFHQRDTLSGGFIGHQHLDRAKVDAGFRCVLDLKSEAMRRVQTDLDASVENFHAHTDGKRVEITTLATDEMVLLDMTSWGYPSAKALDVFAELPVTHLFVHGGSLKKPFDALKQMPLRVLSMDNLFPEENFLETVRGFPCNG